MKKPLKIAIILGVVAAVVTLCLFFFWYSTYKVFNSTISYVTEELVYNEYFQKSENDLQRMVENRESWFIVQPIDGKAVVYSQSTQAGYVIDLATGRELMGFPTLENWRSQSRRYYLELMGDGTVKVTRFS